LDFAPQLEKNGLNQLVIHARTLPGMFNAKPNWEIVKKLNNNLNIPIIYNGGIKTPEDAKFYLEKTGCKQLMIGQASIGNPWIFKEIKYFLEHNKKLEISLDTKKQTIIDHANLIIFYFGEKGLVGFRSQFSAYLKNLQAQKQIRKLATQITTLSEIKKILDKI